MRNMSKKTWKLRVWNHMTEMQKLDILLKHAKVPHTYGRRWPEMDRPDNQEFLPGGRHDGGEQIIAYDAAGNRIWDGIWGWGSYGFEQRLIEVMGTQALGHDDVEGWLTARQVTKMWRCRNAAKNLEKVCGNIRRFLMESIKWLLGIKSPTEEWVRWLGIPECEARIGAIHKYCNPLQELEIARNHFENCDPEFITAAIFELNAAECRVDAARRCVG
jgi:hypothetical protein